MSRQQELQAAIDREVTQRTSDLIMLAEGQLFALQLQSHEIERSPIAWILRAHKGTLEKLKSLLPNAANETSLGLVALARNLFENLIWLKHFNLDLCYGIAFYRDLLQQQEQSQTQAILQAKEESLWFKELGKEDGIDLDSASDLIERLDSLTEDERSLLRLKLNAKAVAVDAKADRRFSIYGHQAKTNSYEFQAHLIETEIIPQHEERLDVIRRHIDELQKDIPSLLSQIQINLISKRWNWKQRATGVGMHIQYEFIYSFTSKLLHSGGMNLITETDLSTGERDILLDYIRFASIDAHDEIARFTFPGQLRVRAISA